MEVTNTTILDLEDSINQIVEKRQQVALQKQEIEEKLANLNNLFKTRGRMPDHEYRAVCKNQDSLKAAKTIIERQLADLKTEIRKKEMLRSRLKLENKSTLPENELGIVEQLTYLKNHYINFAADGSRVASMRKMAAEFAEKLEDLITDYNP